MANLSKKKAGIERVLREDGVVLVSARGFLAAVRGDEGRRRLAGACTAIQQVVRCKDRIRSALFTSPSETVSARAWEVLLNLRHRAVLKRLAGAADPVEERLE